MEHLLIFWKSESNSILPVEMAGQRCLCAVWALNHGFLHVLQVDPLQVVLEEFLYLTSYFRKETNAPVKKRMISRTMIAKSGIVRINDCSRFSGANSC